MNGQELQSFKKSDSRYPIFFLVVDSYFPLASATGQ